MKRNILTRDRLAALLVPAGLIRARTHDVAYTYRMPSGIPGDISRFPATVEAALMCVATPPTLYGQAVVADQAVGGVRPLTAGDTALSTSVPYGITVRPFPAANANTTDGLGVSTPPAPPAIIDVMRRGYMTVQLNAAAIAAGLAIVKGAPAYIWIAATSGSHTQSGWEVAAGGGSNTILFGNTSSFNGPCDSSGNIEIEFNI